MQEDAQRDVEQLSELEQDLLDWQREKRKIAFPWRQL